ncbi:AAA family ATPase [Streptomyces longwoodensis]|uniref:AAA family ATPase n=1 Tax=Streptomyces longwoodensis TaxID=68231 RepID=UPI0036FA80B3
MANATEAENTIQSTQDASKVIVVSGESVVDWVIARPEGTGSRQVVKLQRSQLPVRGDEVAGGTQLVDDLVHKVKTEDFRAVDHRWPSAWCDREFTKLSHSYATLRLYPIPDEKVKSENGNRRWRVDEYLGTIYRPQECQAETESGHEGCTVAADDSEAAIVVLVDSGIDYRSNERHWPTAITSDVSTPWVVLKLGGEEIAEAWSEAQSGLWSRLKNRKDKLIVVTTVDDLRRNKGVEISRGLSWERTAGDCATALKGENSPLAELATCAYVVVSFGPAGALLFARDTEADEGGAFTVIFNPQQLEGSAAFWREGKMWGYTSTLTAAIAHALMDHCSNDEIGKPQIKQGVYAGLQGMRTVYEEGFGKALPGNKGELRAGKIQFPTGEVAKEIVRAYGAETHGDLAEATFKPSPALHSWKILNDKYNKFTCNLLDLARKVAISGPAALKGCPWREYGKLTTVDRGEIESFESIRSLVVDYSEKAEKRDQRQGKGGGKMTPLSIAVFGAPGSGKSTAVEEVINSLKLPGVSFEAQTFNLSQFTSPGDLRDAFHLVRDERLRGNVPLVFWDEFDVSFQYDLGWLRYFLSPMQDGAFREGQAVHPIGQSIFVFAGGTSDNLRAFQRQPNFSAAKGPDFLSRVHGSIELRGINAIDGDTEFDSHYVIRRAILLNSILKRETTLLDKRGSASVIDPGVLQAFLTVSEYRHGVRSMRAIVTTSTLAGEDYFGRSNLPAKTQLDLHVDAKDFYAKMRN